MGVFKVLVHGRGLWNSVDDEIQCSGFFVTRVVEAENPIQASQLALELVTEDPKAAPLPEYDPPTLVVDEVVPADAVPSPQPGFAFYPESEVES